MGGSPRTAPRAAFTLALLVLVSLTPAVGAAQTCVNAGLFSFCVNDPTVTNAGSLSVVNGAPAATAQGGLAVGAAGPVTFAASYTFQQASVASGASYSYTGWLEVRGPQGLLGSAFVTALIDAANPGPHTGTLTVSLPSTEPLLGGGSVQLRVQATRVTPSSHLFLGDASSTAPVLIAAVASPSDLQDGVKVGETYLAGSGQADASSATASLRDGDVVVAAGTHLRVQATATLSSASAPGGFHSTQAHAHASFCVSLDTGFGSCVSRTAFSEGCQASAPTCAFPGQSRTLTLEVLVPGNALEARSIASTSLTVESDGYAYNSNTGDSIEYYTMGGDSGRSIVYVAGA